MSSDLELLKGGVPAIGRRATSCSSGTISRSGLFRQQGRRRYRGSRPADLPRLPEAAERFREEALPADISVRNRSQSAARPLPAKSSRRRGRRHRTQSVVDLGASPTSVMAARRGEFISRRYADPCCGAGHPRALFLGGHDGAEIGAILGCPRTPRAQPPAPGQGAARGSHGEAAGEPELFASTLSNIEAWAGRAARDQPARPRAGEESSGPGDNRRRADATTTACRLELLEAPTGLTRSPDIAREPRFRGVERRG